MAAKAWDPLDSSFKMACEGLQSMMTFSWPIVGNWLPEEDHWDSFTEHGYSYSRLLKALIFKYLSPAQSGAWYLKIRQHNFVYNTLVSWQIILDFTRKIRHTPLPLVRQPSDNLSSMLVSHVTQPFSSRHTMLLPKTNNDFIGDNSTTHMTRSR